MSEAKKIVLVRHSHKEWAEAVGQRLYDLGCSQDCVAASTARIMRGVK